MKIRPLLLAALAVLMGTNVAASADLRVRKAPPAPVPLASYSWTGFYLGANVGYGVGAHDVRVDTVAGPNLLIVPAGTTLYGGPNTFDLSPEGVIGGLQIGYNWQASPNVVFGIEADIQGADLNARQDCFLPCGTLLPINNSVLAAIFPVTFTDISVEHQLDWFGTLRGRLGYAAGPALFYVTGGLAYGSVETRSNVAGATTVLGLVNLNTIAGSYTNDQIEVGWTVGGGIEAQFSGNWTMKAEYLYVDLGEVTDSFNTTFTTGLGAGLLAASRTVSSEIREHIFRVGINYKLGSSVIANY